MEGNLLWSDYLSLDCGGKLIERNLETQRWENGKTKVQTTEERTRLPQEYTAQGGGDKETDYQNAMAGRAAANVGRIKPLEGCQLLRYESQDYVSVW